MSTLPSPCCPPNAWGACNAPSSYVNKGTIENLGPKLQAYIVRPIIPKQVSSALLVSCDIFGIESGRTRAICDDMAERLGVLVVLPLYLEASAGSAWKESWGMPNSPWYNLFWFLPWLYRCNLNKLSVLVQNELLPYLERNNVTQFVTASFCWGVGVSAHLSSLPACRAHVGFHPSYNTLAPSFGPSQTQVLSKIACKQLYLVGKADNVTVGGEVQLAVQQLAKQECEVRVFDKQVHGFVNRSDVTKPEHCADVELALELAEAFFKTVL